MSNQDFPSLFGRRVCPVEQAAFALGGLDAVEGLGHNHAGDDGCYWYAETLCRGDVPIRCEVRYYRLHTIRRTPCGAWVQADFESSPKWRALTKLASTQQEALQHLFYRKRSYLRHATRRRKQAKAQFDTVSELVHFAAELDEMEVDA